MKDIAREAGVSQPTVSLVLNGRATTIRIADKTKQKILKTAERMGYRRNEIARAIKTGKTNVIGVIGGFSGSYSMDILTGIANSCTRSGYFMKLLPVIKPGDLNEIIQQCIGHRVAGVICRSIEGDTLNALRSELEAVGIPIVLVDARSHHDWCSRISSDDFNGMKEAVSYLYRLGHRKIAHIASSLDSEFSRIRAEGYLSAMRELGLDSENNICETQGYLTLSNKERAIIIAFFNAHKPTAVVCGSDPVAMQVLMVCHETGIKVPDDLSVIGFAGLDYTFFSSPPLTTISQPFIEMGEKAFDLLLHHIKGGSKVSDVELATSLVVRSSTCAIDKK